MDPVRECRKEQALSGKAVPGGKREECEGPRSKAQRTDWPVLIDFGSVGCMGLLGSASAFLKRMRTALELAGLTAVLLTRCSPRCNHTKATSRKPDMQISSAYITEEFFDRSRLAARARG